MITKSCIIRLQIIGGSCRARVIVGLSQRFESPCVAEKQLGPAASSKENRLTPTREYDDLLQRSVTLLSILFTVPQQYP